jgi:HlyD family secretion protein
MAEKKKRKWLPYLLVGSFIALAGAGIAMAGKGKKGTDVTAENAQKRSISETVTGSGKLFYETEIKISSDVSGEVIELYVQEGDTVKAGQILAKIRPDEYQSAVEQGQASVNTARAQRDISAANINNAKAQLEQFKADRARAEANLEVARNAFDRSEKLYKEGVISTSEFESAKGNMKAAEAAYNVAIAVIQTGETGVTNARENVRVSDYGINSANARLKELRTSLQKTIITAPIDGIVTKLNVEKGERVLGTIQMSGTEIMRVAEQKMIEVQVDVSENDILKVSVGDRAEIEVDAYLGRKFAGRVSEIANSASNVGTTGAALNTDQVTNFIIKIQIDPNAYADLIQKGRPHPFRSGMSASVDVFTETIEQALTVPINSVTTREDKKEENTEEDGSPQAKKVAQLAQKIQEIVFVVSGDTVAVRPVTVGIQDNDFIEIKSGLSEGEQVVTGPYSAIARTLESGTKIKVVDKDDLTKKKK